MWRGAGNPSRGGRIPRAADARRRLRLLLGLFLVVLAVPIGVLLHRAYGQLDQEALHLLQRQATEVAARLEDLLGQPLALEEERPSAEYSFFNVLEGPWNQAGLRLSPLAEFPARPGVPGLLGHFQIHPDGGFHSPLLPDPASGANPANLGLADLPARQARVGEIRALLLRLGREAAAGPGPERRRKPGAVASLPEALAPAPVMARLSATEVAPKVAEDGPGTRDEKEARFDLLGNLFDRGASRQRAVSAPSAPVAPPAMAATQAPSLDRAKDRDRDKFQAKAIAKDAAMDPYAPAPSMDSARLPLGAATASKLAEAGREGRRDGQKEEKRALVAPAGEGFALAEADAEARGGPAESWAVEEEKKARTVNSAPAEQRYEQRKSRREKVALPDQQAAQALLAQGAVNATTARGTSAPPLPESSPPAAPALALAAPAAAPSAPMAPGASARALAQGRGSAASGPGGRAGLMADMDTSAGQGASAAGEPWPAPRKESSPAKRADPLAKAKGQAAPGQGPAAVNGVTSAGPIQASSAKEAGLVRKAEEVVATEEARRPETAQPQARARSPSPAVPAPAAANVVASAAANVAAPAAPAMVNVLPPVSLQTFESEVEPLVLLPIGEEHLCFFRRIWHPEGRYIQGFLVERAAFLAPLATAFQDSPLDPVATLRLTWRGQGIPMGGQDGAAAQGVLLHQRSLAPPLDGYILEIRASALPPPPGKPVLDGLALALALILVGGGAGLYLLGARQIALVEQQRNFVAAVSHELKTPLTSIRMYSEILRAGWITDEEKRREYYDFLFAEAERLSRLIHNVLSLARLGNREPPPPCKPHPVEGLLRLVAGKAATLTATAGFTLEVVPLAPAVRALAVLTDEDYVVQICINLVDNAVKFAQDAPERTVEMGAEARGGGAGPVREVVFYVRDHGPGVPKESRRRIFELFQRGSDEAARQRPGTGIGLALARQLAERMGATLVLADNRPGDGAGAAVGAGARFELILPIAPG
jgi:signal transduction histidine kinase